jgi:hypothetical protein
MVMNIDIHAITVCVYYSHLLKLCTSNKRFFKRWVIVTIEDDIETINLCKEHNLEYIFSETLYTRTFAKGCAINEAFDYLGKDEEWYLHIDADIILPENFSDIVQIDPLLNRPILNGYKKKEHGSFEYFSKNGNKQFTPEFIDCKYQAHNLYTMGRVNINQNESIDNFDPQQYWNSHNQIEDQFKGWGYFQLFHLPTFNRIHSNLHQIYPTLSNDAGADDLIFAGMFFNILDLDTFCIHLSEPKVNWKGIK